MYISEKFKLLQKYAKNSKIKSHIWNHWNTLNEYTLKNYEITENIYFLYIPTLPNLPSCNDRNRLFENIIRSSLSVKRQSYVPVTSVTPLVRRSTNITFFTSKKYAHYARHRLTDLKEYLSKII
jgi:hypothetical protein